MNPVRRGGTVGGDAFLLCTDERDTEKSRAALFWLDSVGFEKVCKSRCTL